MQEIFVVEEKRSFLEKFIYSIGIRHIGIENAKLIATYLKSINNFLEFVKNNNFDHLSNIDGMGETTININIKNNEKGLNFKLENKRNLDRKTINLIRNKEISAIIN